MRTKNLMREGEKTIDILMERTQSNSPIKMGKKGKSGASTYYTKQEV